MDKKVEIGRRIKEFAEKKFSSTAELSRQLGMKNRQGLNPYIQGKSFPGSELLLKLTELGCDVNWLLKGEGVQTTIIAHEQPELYMTYADLNQQIETQKKELDSLKIENYDLRKNQSQYVKTIEELKEQITDMEKEIKRLKSQGGLSLTKTA